MKLSIQRIIAVTQNSMSANCAFFKLQLANISIKAEAEALLSLSVSTERGELDIEDVAEIAIPCDDKFVIVPKEAIHLFNICKAIALEHPEYKLERKVYKDDGDENNKDLDSFLLDDTDEADIEDLVICCTMPEMNQERRDTAVDLVHTLYDRASVALDKIKMETQEELVEQLSGEDPLEMDEAKDKLEEIYNQNKSECARYQQEKEDEINKAYQTFLAEQSQKEKAKEDLEEAQNQQAAKSLSFEDMMNSEE